MTVSPDRALEIGIGRLTIVSEMARAMRIARTKEDILYIMGKMQNELKEGIAELEGE